MLNLTVSRRVFHTWLVIFTPGFDICVSYCACYPQTSFHMLNLSILLSLLPDLLLLLCLNTAKYSVFASGGEEVFLQVKGGFLC